MAFLEEIKGVDILLIDQILKGRIGKEHMILDAGCGSGRNSIPLLKQGFNVTAFDPNPTCSASFIEYPDRFIHCDIANFVSINKFNFIICNAVLHFAKNHSEFDNMIHGLVHLLSQNGILFIRMISDLAFKTPIEINEFGRSVLSDGSTRYILTQDKLNALISENELKLIDSVKTVNVENLRCMTTLVLSKN